MLVFKAVISAYKCFSNIIHDIKETSRDDRGGQATKLEPFTPKPNWSLVKDVLKGNATLNNVAENNPEMAGFFATIGIKYGNIFGEQVKMFLLSLLIWKEKGRYLG